MKSFFYFFDCLGKIKKVYFYKNNISIVIKNFLPIGIPPHTDAKVIISRKKVYLCEGNTHTLSK